MLVIRSRSPVAVRALQLPAPFWSIRQSRSCAPGMTKSGPCAVSRAFRGARRHDANSGGPIVLGGHSYGGFVIINAATGNANVKALVYIAPPTRLDFIRR